MRVNVIVAMASNRVIGRDGALPWHLSDDLKRFKAITMGHPIVMGRKTFESIGRVLPGRLNVVISSQADYWRKLPDIVPQQSGITSASNRHQILISPSLEVAFSLLEHHSEIMVIGGAALYESALPIAERLYLTEVHQDVDGDVRFPTFSRDAWEEMAREDFEGRADSPPYSFCILEKRKSM